MIPQDIKIIQSLLSQLAPIDESQTAPSGLEAVAKEFFSQQIPTATSPSQSSCQDIQDGRWQKAVSELNQEDPFHPDIRKVSAVFLSQCTEEEIKTILGLDKWLASGSGESGDKEKAVSRIVAMIQEKKTTLDLSYLSLVDLPESIFVPDFGLSDLKLLFCKLRKMPQSLSVLSKLQTLDCSGNELISLDVSNLRALQTLDCSGNELISLDVSNLRALQTLRCSNNKLRSLDVFHLHKLQRLSCGDNQLSSLDVSNLRALQTLYCSCNELSSLDVFHLHELQRLSCENNQLSSLDVSNLHALKELNCSRNYLDFLTVSNLPALRVLYCMDNELSSLTVSNLPQLRELNCIGKLTSLDVSNLPRLRELNCERSELISLTVSNLPSLETLKCRDNYLTSLTVSGSPALRSLDCRGNQGVSPNVSDAPELQITQDPPAPILRSRSAPRSAKRFLADNKQIIDKPLEVLSRLCNHIKGSDLSVRFTDSLNTVDAGGPKRQLIGDLFESLFSSEKKALKFHKEKEGGVVPILETTPEEVYQNIGYLLGFTYTNKIPIGAIFSRKVFEAFSYLLQSGENINDPLTNLKVSCILNYPEEIRSTLFKALEEENPSFSSEEEEYLSYAMFPIPLNKEEIAKEIKEELEKGNVPAVKLMVEGFKKRVGKIPTDLFNPQILEEAVQGNLSLETVFQAFKASILRNTSLENLPELTSLSAEPRIAGNDTSISKESLACCLFYWIKENAKKDSGFLKKFVRAMLGSSGLYANTPLNLVFTNQKQLPSCQTCSGQLVLSTDKSIYIPETRTSDQSFYPCFAERMDLWMQASEEGGGFQTG